MMLLYIIVLSLPGLMTAVSPSSNVFALRYIINNKTFNMNFNITLFSQFQRCLTDEAIYSCTLQSNKINLHVKIDEAFDTDMIGIETKTLTKPTILKGIKLCTLSLYKLSSLIENYFSIYCVFSEDPCGKEIAIDFVRDMGTSRCGYTCWSFSENIMFVYNPEIKFSICDSGPRFTLPIEPNGSVVNTRLTTPNVLQTVGFEVFSDAISASTSTSRSSDSSVTVTASTSVVQTTTSSDLQPAPSSLPPTSLKTENVAATTAVLRPTTQQPTTTITHTTTPLTTTPKPITSNPLKTITQQRTTTPQSAPALLPTSAPSPTTTTITMYTAYYTNQLSSAATADTINYSLDTEIDKNVTPNPTTFSKSQTALSLNTSTGENLIETILTTSTILTSPKIQSFTTPFPRISNPKDGTETLYSSSPPSVTMLSTFEMQHTSQKAQTTNVSTIKYQVANLRTTETVAVADSDTTNSTIVIVLSVIVSILAVATAAIFLYLFLQRRRRKRTLKNNESTRVLRADDSVDMENMRTQQREDSHYSSITEYDPPWGARRGNATPDLISSCEGNSSSDTSQKPAIPDPATIPRSFDVYSKLHLPLMVKKPEPGGTNTSRVPAIYDNARLQDMEPIYNLSSFSDYLNNGGNQTSTPKRDTDTGRMLKFHDVNPYSIVILDPTLFNTSLPETGFSKHSNQNEHVSNNIITLDSVPNEFDRGVVSNYNKNEPEKVDYKMVTKDFSDRSEIESDCLSVSATSSFNIYSGKDAMGSPREDKTLAARKHLPGTPLRFVFPARVL